MGRLEGISAFFPAYYEEGNVERMVAALLSRVIFLESTPNLRYFGIALIIVGILLSSVAKG